MSDGESKGLGVTLTRVPWARVVAEGAVIVVSILLAFGLDAWWDRRGAAQREAEILEALSSEFTLTQRRVADAHSRRETILSALSIIDDSLRASRSARVPLSDSIAGWAFFFSTADIPSSVLSSIVASGEVSLLRDGELQGLLAQWPALVDDAREEEILVRDLIYEQFIPATEGLERLIGSAFGPTMQAALAGNGMYVDFPNNPAVRTRLAARLRLERILLGEYGRLLEAVDRILGRLPAPP